MSRIVSPYSPLWWIAMAALWTGIAVAFAVAGGCAILLTRLEASRP